jgi:kynureninase
MHRIREKSVALSEYLVFLYDEMLKDHGFLLGTPRDVSQRGSHVSLQHPEAYRICKAMIDPADQGFKIIPDFREPDNIRLGIAPLYNSYLDIYKAVERINAIVEKKIFEQYSREKEAVT